MKSTPFWREAGEGQGVVCLHANAGSSGQWRALMERLAPDFRVLAPDSWSAGRSPRWVSDRIISLADEVRLLEPVLARAGSGAMLVGHSYGAAIALKAALLHPRRVRALALYEPTLFSLLDAESPSPNDADGIRECVAEAAYALDAGDEEAAAARFIDYWMGDGSWAATPHPRRTPIVSAVAHVRMWGHALFTEPAPLDAFRALDIPVLYMTGGRSPASAQGVARLLTQALPQVEVVEFAELGHMGPLTHPDRVNAMIEEFLCSEAESKVSQALG